MTLWYKEAPKMPLGSFSVGCLLLGMQFVLKTNFSSAKLPWQKPKFSFESSYPLNITSELGTELCLLPFSALGKGLQLVQIQQIHTAPMNVDSGFIYSFF